jgi:hypothetical protein
VVIQRQDTPTLFSLLHDGEISACSATNDTLSLVVTIPYLAERINPTFTTFTVVLHQVQSIAFHTWPRSPAAQPTLLTQPEDIFQAPLDILQAHSEEEKLVIACAQTEPHYDYVGGTLALTIGAITVRDEANSYYSIEMLVNLANGYWSDWKGK